MHLCVYFDEMICRDIALPFFRSGNYEMEDKEYLRAATKFTAPNHTMGWEENGVIILNKNKTYSKLP